MDSSALDNAFYASTVALINVGAPGQLLWVLQYGTAGSAASGTESDMASDACQTFRRLPAVHPALWRCLSMTGRHCDRFPDHQPHPGCPAGILCGSVRNPLP